MRGRGRGVAAAWVIVLGACASGGGAPREIGPARAIASASPSAMASTSATVTDSTTAHDPPSDPELSAPVATIAADEGVGLAEGPAGHLGAWLALGPFLLPDKSPPATTTAWRPRARGDDGSPVAGAPPLDDHAFEAAFGQTLPTRVDRPVREPTKDGKPGKVKSWSTAPATWTVVASGDGAIDLEKAWNSAGKPAVGYLAATLRLPVARALTMLVGSDDGCEVIVDGTTRFVRDGSRAQRDDDDFVPLDLAAGDHRIVLKLHQHDAGWAIRVRVVDDALRPPLGARWLLPKAPPTLATELAQVLSWVRPMRAPLADGYELSAEVRFPEGAPLGVPLDVRAALLGADGGARIAEKSLGSVPIGPRGVGVLHGALGTASLEADERDGKDVTLRIDVAGRRVDAPLRPRAEVRTAIARARATTARWSKEGRPESIPDDVPATLDALAERLAGFVARGDDDVRAQLLDAQDLTALVADADAGKDPLAHRSGAMRLAHLARADGKPQPFALYVPAGFDATTKKYPLFVALHGMNSGPMSALRIFFGGDDEGKTMSELDRRFEGVQSTRLGAFVLAPHAHGNAMFRQLGEEEVMDSLAWALQRYPQIDPNRIYVTGYSMGGIGAASIPLHHPDVFAAAEPLCGYHSFAIRRDVAGRPRRPWESYLIEDRSNVEWAPNGARLPLYVIHGTHDLPEENSGVLIDAYRKLDYSIKDDHPDKGHDVWGWAYDHFAQVDFFAGRRRDPHPRHVRLRTTRPRFGDDAWVHVERLAASGEWGVLDASIAGTDKKPVVRVKTKNVGQLRLDRDPALIAVDAPIALTIDGHKLTVPGDEPIVLHRDGEAWSLGAAIDEGPVKEKHLAGPIRDVWHEPLRIVYGASDPRLANANLEVARSLARIRWGVDVEYPIVADDAVDPDALPDTATILVGNAASNRLTRALEPLLPIRLEADGVVVGGKKYTGKQLGAAFVVPHPRAPGRYLLVVEGVDALGTLRALSLPELLPDFVVWDEHLAPARGQQLLSFGAVLAGGYFDARWRLPSNVDDPLFGTMAAPKSEKDATSYLP